MESTNTQKTKSTKQYPKLAEKPHFTISLDFSNNLFQTFILDVFERLNTQINIETIKFNIDKISNLIKIEYKSDYIFLQFYDTKFLADSITNKQIFKTAEILKSISGNPSNIAFVFFAIKKKEFIEANEIEFFMQSNCKIKIFHCANNSDLFHFLENYLSAISSKEEKAKLTYFDLKPVTNSNLAELDDLNDNSRIWVKHLMCIPGISEMKAIAIVRMYPTFKSLIEIYESDEFIEAEKERFLRDVEVVNNAKNSRKRLGDVVSSKVYKYFCGKDLK